MRDRWATGRVEASSDGVIAIAITLLVLEIHGAAVGLDNLWRGIANQWPSYLAFATSFADDRARSGCCTTASFSRLRYADATDHAAQPAAG